MAEPAADSAGIRNEFTNLSLGDARLSARAQAIADAIAASPGNSFPHQEITVAGREALYRFFSNAKVTMEGLLEGHKRATLARLKGRPVIRVVHDSTSFEFRGDRDGLGVLLGNKMGFKGHFSLAITADEAREPLGILAVSTLVRRDTASHRRLPMAQRNKMTRAKPRSEKESSRWERQALAIADDLPAETRAIHVMDQEADSFVMLAELTRAGVDFVVRGSPQRRTMDGLVAKDLLEHVPSHLFRSVRLSTREQKPGGSLSRTRRPRIEREAHLEIRWGTVTLPGGHQLDYPVTEIGLNAVHVFEPSPPPGEEPVNWMLFTSEVVHTLEDATAVVDHYRARWVIEEYFKALKTGCAIEKRQLTSYDSLTRALALFVPIAWQLLALRHLSRVEAERDASSLFDGEQLLLLAALMKKHRLILREPSSIRDVMLAIAALGGHIRSNGDPGWQVLGRGYTRFIEAEAVWRLARNYDQS
jgi:hypothetical protein